MRRFLFLFIIFFATVLNAFSQGAQLNVKGTVLDNYGHPLKGVEIKIKNNSVSVISDENGNFELTTAAEAVLVFSSERFNISEVKVSNNHPIVIRLSERYLRASSKENIVQTTDTTNEVEPSNKINVLYEEKYADKILGSVSSVYTNQLSTTPAPLYAYA